MNSLYMPELQALYRQGRLIPFIGAGASISVSWQQDGVDKRGPSWRQLVDAAAKQLGFAQPDLLRARGTDLQILEYYKLKKDTFSPLINWLHSEMQPPDDALRASPIHLQLARMDQCRLFYTTNYDYFLERSFDLHGRAATKIVTEFDISSRVASHGNEICEIVKFHGDLDHPDTMVISESHYQRRLKLETVMDYRLRSDVLGRALLFIGYGFGDWNVSYLFRLVNDQFGQLPDSDTGRRAYIIATNPSDFERRLFRDRNIGILGIDGRDQTAATADVLAVIRS